MDQATMRDKIYAGWMGKNIGGTLGGPLEGRMELMDIHSYTQAFNGPVENDDLDLQLLNLHCAEQYGGLVTTQLLQREWRSHVFFEYDEYGQSLTNLRKGLLAPMAGHYNNFFTDCMGSPIRSEIWGMVCAGNPDLAAYFARQDANVDHAGGEGVWGEIFFAVLESLAFTNDNIPWLIEKSLSYLPEACVTRQAVECLLACHKASMSWQEARQEILTRYAGDNFTYAPVNIAFTLVGLLYAQGFTARLLTTTNCGYDTDCTCATIASIMGILYGSAYIDSMWTEPLGENILVSEPVKGINPPATITALTERTLALQTLLDAQYADKARVNGFEELPNVLQQVAYIPCDARKGFDLCVRLTYDDDTPCIAPHSRKTLTFTIKNGLDVPYEAELSLESALASSPAQTLSLAPGQTGEYTFTLTASADKQPVYPVTLCVARTMHGCLWAVERIAFAVLPTMDWHMAGKTVHYKTSQLVGAPCDAFAAETTLVVPSDRAAKLIVSCEAPVTLVLDGKTVIDCAEWTPFIPAYHRSDERKCFHTQLTAGEHTVAVTADHPQKLNFYVVSDAAYCADCIDILQK